MSEAVAKQGATPWLRLAIWSLSAVVTVVFCILFVDRAVATWSHDALHRPHWAVAITKLADARVLEGIAAAILVAASLAKLTGRRIGAAWRIAIAASFATLLAMAAIILLKYGFGRLWPETWVQNNPSWIGSHAYGFLPLHGGAGYESFPSGHTARFSAPFAVLWQRLPRLRLVWAVPPLIMAFALVAADYHFVGDCLAGIYVAIGCAAFAMQYV